MREDIYLYISEIMFVVGLAIAIGLSGMVIGTLKDGIVNNSGVSASSSAVLSTLGTLSLLISPLLLITIVFFIILMVWQFKEVR